MIQNRQYKENNIISNLLNCTNEIKKINKKFQLIKKTNLELFENNFNELFNKAYGSIDLSESVTYNLEMIRELNLANSIPLIQNEYNNSYAYFQKIYNFLDDYEINIQKELNESFENNKLTGIYDIFGFKNELEKIIKKLNQIDETDVVSKHTNLILKTKIFAGTNIHVLGFDIINNIDIKTKIFELYKINENQIYSIIFDKSNKLLIFLTNSNLILFDIKTNNFDIKNVNSNEITHKNYFDYISTNYNKNIIEIYTNIQTLNSSQLFTFEDNLYKDNMKKNIFDEINKKEINSKIIKK